MSDEHKKRVELAMLAHHQKQIPRKRNKVHNDSPERDFVIKLIKHLQSLHFSIDVVDSKANYNAQAGMYINNVTRAGFSDLVGNDNEGRAVFIEAKAKDRRSTLRPDQRTFLIEKINSNCFAIVCDSLAYFDKTYSSWTLAVDKKKFLLDELPKLSASEKRRADQNLTFDD